MEFKLSVPKHEEWYDRELNRIYDEVPTRRGDGFLVMGCPVWGPEFVRQFIDWCVPTAMEAESAAALKGRCRLVVVTPDADRRHLLNHLHVLDRADIELQFITISDELLALANENHNHKLFLLGTAQKLILQVARRLRAAFHMLMPDHNHSAGYFARIDDLRRSHDAIVQCGISAEREPVQAKLKLYRKEDESISVPALDLADMAWRHMHKHHRSNVMAPAHPTVSIFPNHMQRSQLMLWRTRDRLVAHSCRPNPVWLSANLVNDVPIDLQRPATLDCEVPILARMLKGGRVYAPTADDGMIAVELTPGADKQVEDARLPFDEFAKRAWIELRYSDTFLKLYRQRSEFALSPDETVTVTDAEIARSVGQVTDLLLKHRPGIEHELMQRIASAPETLA